MEPSFCCVCVWLHTNNQLFNESFIHLKGTVRHCHFAEKQHGHKVSN